MQYALGCVKGARGVQVGFKWEKIVEGWHGVPGVRPCQNTPVELEQQLDAR